MTAKTEERQAISTILTGRWERTAAKLADLARAVPEEQYETAPIAGVRTFGDVLRHVAFWNRYVAQVARGAQADDSANELPKAEYATKEEAIAALTESAAVALEALRGGMDSEKAALAESFIEHTCEHYGQLVVYARMAGVVPPVSH
jgi:uncharacterized damage-inducible protein DinB